MERFTKKISSESIEMNSIHVNDTWSSKKYDTTVKTGKCIDKLGEIEDTLKKLDCPSLDLFLQLHEVNGVYCEIEIALSHFPSETVYLEIDRLGLDGIYFKKNKYDLGFIEYRYYKNCFWLKRDKTE